MSAKCDGCGRFSAELTEVMLIPPSPYSDGSWCTFCTRCLRLFDHGWTECHAEVVERDGMLGPCDLPAYDVIPDPEFGEPSPVCRRHYREWSGLSERRVS